MALNAELFRFSLFPTLINNPNVVV